MHAATVAAPPIFGLTLARRMPFPAPIKREREKFSAGAAMTCPLSIAYVRILAFDTAPPRTLRSNDSGAPLVLNSWKLKELMALVLLM